MKKIHFFPILFVACVLSCRKEDPAPTLPPEPEIPVDSSGYYGVFFTYVERSVNSNILIDLASYSNVCFRKSTTTYTAVPPIMSPDESVKVESVNLNGIDLSYSNYSNFYTAAHSPVSPITWTIKGAGSIPDFSFTNTDPLPVYAGYSSLPDTLYVNHPDSVKITGVTNSEETSVNLEDSSGRNFTEVLPSSATSVFFSSSALSKASATPGYATIRVLCKNSNVTSSKGKLFHFTTFYIYKKSVVIRK